MRALNCGFVEPEVGFEPTTFRLRVEEPSSSRYQPGRFWLLTSAGSSSQCVPDLPSYGRGNDQENDRADSGETHRTMRPSDRDRKVADPIGKSSRRRCLIGWQGEQLLWVTELASGVWAPRLQP